MGEKIEIFFVEILLFLKIYIMGGPEYDFVVKDHVKEWLIVLQKI